MWFLVRYNKDELRKLTKSNFLNLKMKWWEGKGGQRLSELLALILFVIALEMHSRLETHFLDGI